MFMSKMTATTLEDTDYIVDASMVRFESEYAVVRLYLLRRSTMILSQRLRELPPSHATAGRHLSVKTVRWASGRNSEVNRKCPMNMIMCFLIQSKEVYVAKP